MLQIKEVHFTVSDVYRPEPGFKEHGVRQIEKQNDFFNVGKLVRVALVPSSHDTAVNVPDGTCHPAGFIAE